jgi:hypothetical protein
MKVVEVRSLTSLGYDEKWLQDYICDNPSQLGLGEDVVPIYRERRQLPGGRLDILLADKEADILYELEVMLGATDETHIVRTIEYWENERRKWPSKKHVAVLLAEKITSRFYTVIRLLSEAIPIIGMQINVVDIEGTQGLFFQRIVDLYAEPEVEESPSTYKTEDQFRKDFPRLFELMVVVKGILTEAQIPTRERYLNDYIAVPLFGKDRLWIGTRKGGEPSMSIVPDEECHSKAAELVRTFSYRVKESTDGTIYFRAAPDQLSNNRESFLQLVALLKPAQGEA